MSVGRAGQWWAVPLFVLWLGMPLQRPERSHSLEQAEKISPPVLVKLLSGPSAERPLIVQVGFEVLYRSAHIPGAAYAGPAARPAGLRRLRQLLARVPRSRPVVLYCGCCPWDKCPNIGPAYEEVVRMGFHHVRVLYLPNDFARDWVNQGLPVAQGPPH